MNQSNTYNISVRRVPKRSRKDRKEYSASVIVESGGGSSAQVPVMHNDLLNIMDVTEDLSDDEKGVHLTGALAKLLVTIDQARLDKWDKQPVGSKNVRVTDTDLGYLIETMDDYISKTKADTAEKTITFKEGVEFGEYIPGSMGSGGKVEVDEETGYASMVIDKLWVRKEATFNVLNIHELKAVGGEVLITAADMKCINVEEYAVYYRCFFDTDNNTILNQFEPNDQAICQLFDGANLKYYWRLVVSVGTDYIDLSKTDCDGVAAPEIGDSIIQLGNRTNKSRQSAILLSSVSETAPSITQYDGINSFTLRHKDVNVIGKESKFSGKVTFASGSSGYHNIEGLQDEIDSARQHASDLVNGISIGSVNILMNSGFTGDYTSEYLQQSDQLHESYQLYSNPFKYWLHTGDVSVLKSEKSGSKFAVSLNNAEIAQSVNLIPGDKYIVSFRASGNNIKINGESLAVTASDSHYSFPLTVSGNMFKLSGTAIVYDIKLERGTIATAWSPNPNDNPNSLDKLNAINYITQAIKDGNTEILGGLILSSMMQLGMWKDGKIDEITCGMSGIVNDVSDPAFWAGGDLASAIRAIFNPNDPTGAASVITHEGKAIFNDAIIRGIIYATGGKFTGDIETNVAGNRIIISSKTNSIQMINSRNEEIANIGFFSNGEYLLPLITLSSIDNEGERRGTCTISPNAIALSAKNGDRSSHFSVDRRYNGYWTITGDLPPKELVDRGEMYIEDSGKDYYDVRIKK